MQIDDFLNRDLPRYDWLIPGFLERGDRMIVTGEEGHGKSTLIRQIMMAASGGRNPLKPTEKVEPVRTLLIDLENSERELMRELGKLRSLVESSDMHVESRPEGINISTQNSGDWAWAEERIKDIQPALIGIGPLYKTTDGSLVDELVCKRLVKFFDLMRVTYGCTIVIETHSPQEKDRKGNRVIRPTGHMTWQRWPELGYHIDKGGALTAWRVARMAREMPSAMVRGDTINSDWPWNPSPFPRMRFPQENNSPKEDKMRSAICSYLATLPDQTAGKATDIYSNVTGATSSIKDVLITLIPEYVVMTPTDGNKFSYTLIKKWGA